MQIYVNSNLTEGFSRLFSLDFFFYICFIKKKEKEERERKRVLELVIKKSSV